MSIGLNNILQCPGCGSLYQVNLRRLCANCSAEEDRQLLEIERQMRRNRLLDTEQLSELVAIPPKRIRAWIRGGKLKLYDYPNLADECDLCARPIRQGKLCGACSVRIQNEIYHEFEQDRLMKERKKVSSSYFTHQ